jgi:UPF0755 protein
MWRHLAANALTFFVVALFLIAGLVAWGQSRWAQPGPLAQAICFQVESDSTMRQVSRQLAERGAVSSDWIFRAGSDYTDRTARLKAGSFLIPASASMEDVSRVITGSGASTCGTEVVYLVGIGASSARVRELDPATGDLEQTASFDFTADGPVPPEYEAARAEPGTTYWVRVIEGTTSWQVAQALDAIDILEGEVGEVPAEGSLAPNTYDIEPGSGVGGGGGRGPPAPRTSPSTRRRRP